MRDGTLCWVEDGLASSSTIDLNSIYSFRFYTHEIFITGTFARIPFNTGLSGVINAPANGAACASRASPCVPLCYSDASYMCAPTPLFSEVAAQSVAVLRPATLSSTSSPMKHEAAEDFRRATPALTRTASGGKNLGPEIKDGVTAAGPSPPRPPPPHLQEKALAGSTPCFFSRSL